MLQLDIRTIVVLNLVVAAVIAALSWQMWRQNRKTFVGMDCWGGYFALQTVGLALIAGRGHISDWWSIVLGNCALTVGILLISLGLRAFIAGLQRAPVPKWQWSHTAIVVLMGGQSAYFTFVDPQLTVRIVAHSGLAAAIWLQVTAMLLRPEAKRVLHGARPLAAIAGFHATINTARVAQALLQPTGSADLMNPSPAQALFMVVTLAAALALIAALVLVMNQLLQDQANAERDKFRAAFQRAPFALSICRLDDQKLLAVNDTYAKMSGYRQDEIIGHTSEELGLWADPADREVIIGSLETSGPDSVVVGRFRRKNGELFEALACMEYLTIDGIACRLACFADVTPLRTAQTRLEQREAELLAMNDELLRFNRAAVGRELDMIRLKRQVNELSRQQGLEPPYPLDFDAAAPQRPSLSPAAEEG